MSRNDREYLIKLIKENPTLPLVFFVNNDERAWDYGSSVYEDFHCYLETIYDCEDDGYYNDIDFVLEKYADRLCDSEEYKNLSEEEFDKAITDYVDKNVRHYKAIVISVC